MDLNKYTIIYKSFDGLMHIDRLGLVLKFQHQFYCNLWKIKDTRQTYGLVAWIENGNIDICKICINNLPIKDRRRVNYYLVIKKLKS